MPGTFSALCERLRRELHGQIAAVAIDDQHAVAEGFLEGPNFDANDTLWVVGVASGGVMRIENGTHTVVGETSGLPNGAKFAPDGKLIIADIGGSLFSVDMDTGVRTEIKTEYQGQPLRGLNDLVFDSKGGFYFTEAAETINPQTFFGGFADQAFQDVARRLVDKLALHLGARCYPSHILFPRQLDGRRGALARRDPSAPARRLAQTGGGPHAVARVPPHRAPRA